MVHSRLHLICGNCGCNNQWKYNIELDKDIEGSLYPECCILCENCGTLHTLGEVNAKYRRE